jgi:hypothetical protein
MDLLRRNVFWIVCGVVTLAGIALGVTGLRAMPEVVKQMEASTSLHRSLQSMRSSPVNQEVITAEKRRVESIQADYNKVLERARELYNYEPLVKDAFPEGQPLQLMEFRRKYAEAMAAKLNRGDVPTAAEVAAMKERRENELAEQKQAGGSGTAVPAAQARTAAGVLTELGVRDDANARASIAKALSFWTYVVNFNEERPPDRMASLQFRDQMKESGSVEAPPPFDVWMAQVHYWIQKDIVDAIVKVNEIAEKEAKEAGQPVWVGTMAVKDLISVRLSSYVPPEGDLVVVAQPGDYSPGMPPGTGETVFTGTKSGPDFDVIQFTVKAVMDQRDIPLLVEKICNNRFHTLVRTAYTAVPPNRELKGKVYGSEPAVNVVLDFETVMLGDVFRPIMPQEVCDFFEITCPPREEPAEGEQP